VHVPLLLSLWKGPSFFGDKDLFGRHLPSYLGRGVADAPLVRGGASPIRAGVSLSKGVLIFFFLAI